MDEKRQWSATGNGRQASGWWCIYPLRHLANNSVSHLFFKRGSHEHANVCEPDWTFQWKIDRKSREIIDWWRHFPPSADIDFSLVFETLTLWTEKLRAVVVQRRQLWNVYCPSQANVSHLPMKPLPSILRKSKLFYSDIAYYCAVTESLFIWSLHDETGTLFCQSMRPTNKQCLLGICCFQTTITPTINSPFKIKSCLIAARYPFFAL